MQKNDLVKWLSPTPSQTSAVGAPASKSKDDIVSLLVSRLLNKNPQQAGAYIQDTVILRRGGVFTVNQGYDESDSASVAAGATVHLLSVTVPVGSDQSLLITHFANYLSDVSAWGYYTWNMYIDAVPVGPYYGVVDQLGQTNLMRKVGVDILVNAGQTLLIDAVGAGVIPGGPFNAGVSLIGVYGTYDYNRG